MIPEPGLYAGKLRHRRFLPRRHEFKYNLFMAWLDVDRIPEMMAALPWTAYNRFHWASFEERDHLSGSHTTDPKLSLRERVVRDARTHGVELPDGPIYLLTHLRYLGYCFNPISFCYCYDERGRIHSILAEVNNTFGESRNYWLSEANRVESANSFRHVCPKTLHVSPFNPMNLGYEFVLTEPGERLVAHMNTTQDCDRPFFDATLTMEHRAWTTRNVGMALARHPLMTAQVIGAIHWEALRLWMKKVPVFTHPDRVKAQAERLVGNAASREQGGPSALRKVASGFERRE